MAKKTKEKKGQAIGGMTINENCSYKQLKIKAVALGMPFTDVVESDIHGLISYIHRSTNKPNISLIDRYDDWIDKQLELKGYEPGVEIRSPLLRLGFIGEKGEDGSVVKTKRVKGLKKPKVKRERDDSGLYKGTKKSYTYECAKLNFSIERTIRRVLKKFPDAKEKSITIWYRAALRDINKDEKSK